MTTTLGAPAWTIPVLRAVPAAIAAVVITFSANHGTLLGFLAFGGWAVVTAAVLVLGSLGGYLPRRSFLVHAAVLLAGGVAALAAAILVSAADAVAMLLLVISTVLGVSGALELVSGIVLRGLSGARDWVFLGGLTALTAIAVLIIPADFSQVISIPDKEVPALTASVIAVGLFGAYCAIVAVYLVIAGLSLKWAADPAAVTTEKR